MNELKYNERFQTHYREMKKVSLNPRRHTAANAYEHSEAAARMARQLATLNDCSPQECQLMEDLGRAHDIGKISGTARPEQSLRVLDDCDIEDELFLALVKWHDTGLPWWKSARRGQPPSDKAWDRLASQLDMKLLCLFMVADREDAPPGWRGNPPTTWFLEQARNRGLIGDLHFDVPEHASEVSAGGVLMHEERALLIRVRQEGFELPKGHLGWDELAGETALRECREETGYQGKMQLGAALGDVDYFVEIESGRYRKRVHYFCMALEDTPVGKKPKATRERRWISRAELAQVPLVNEDLRPIIESALEAA